MKIIALLPVKNESWILETYLSSISQICDQIIAIDDVSSDSSLKLLKRYNVSILKSTKEDVNMSKKRKLLLEEGRKQGGTHFIWLDADEIFSNNFIVNFRNEISKLKKGQKISMRWIHVWKDEKHFLNDKKSVLGKIWKDFIVYDNKIYKFENKPLSESRTPGPQDKIVKLPQEKGVVLHYQFYDWDLAQLKQAWYRCVELMEQKNNPKKINNTYEITKQGDFITSEIPTKWIRDIQKPNYEEIKNKKKWYLNTIIEYFDKYGIDKFESLDIWHIKEFGDEFIKRVGRDPKPKKYPEWILKLNNIKNLIKNKLTK